MLKAILLDLDNTLVIFDETAFYLKFMDHIAPFFEDKIPKKQFRARLLGAIGRLSKNDGGSTNRAFFMNQFCRGIEAQREAYWERFMRFYENEYDKISVRVATPHRMEWVLDQLERWGLTLVVATNPIFPEIAPLKRMAWVGLDIQRFQLLTHIENTSFVKPRREYYRQICNTINAAPEECLMVGNDPVNDMAAGGIGMKTFLTTEAIPLDYRASTNGRMNRDKENYPADFTGAFADLIPTVARLNGG